MKFILWDLDIVQMSNWRCLNFEFFLHKEGGQSEHWRVSTNNEPKAYGWFSTNNLVNSK